MLRTYFIHIAAVRMAAALTGRRLYDNYAFHGALERFAPVNIGAVKDTEGVPDVAEKAKSFRFGQVCGKILARELSGYDGHELTLCEAAVAKGVFMKLTPETAAKYQPEQLKENIKTIFRALLKYAQIQTHTAKPGGEDINAWLASYNNLLAGYEPCLNELTDFIIASDGERLKKMDAFFNRRDALTALAMKGGVPKAYSPDERTLKSGGPADGSPGTDAPEEAMTAEPSSMFGLILKKIVNLPEKTPY